MEETSPGNNVDETAYEVLHEKPGVHVQDKLGINPRNGLKALLRAEDRYNLVIKRGDDKTGKEVVQVKSVTRDENLSETAAKDEMNLDVVSQTNIDDQAALVLKAVEYIVDYDSD